MAKKKRPNIDSGKRQEDMDASPPQREAASRSNSSVRGRWQDFYSAAGHALSPIYYVEWLVRLIFAAAAGSIGIFAVLYHRIPWRVILPCLGICFGTALLVLCAYYLVQRLTGLRRRGQSLSVAINEKLADDYIQEDISVVVLSQLGLRAALAIFVWWRGMLRPLPVLPIDSTLRVVILFGMIVYLLLSIYYFGAAWKKNSAPASDQKQIELVRVLWHPVYVDLAVITFLSVATRDDNSYHLAYIIPCLGAWLFAGAGKCEQLVKLILAGVCARYCLHGVIHFSPFLSEQLKLPPTHQFVATLATGLAPKFIFWSAATLQFTLLRKVRTVEMARRQEAEERRQVLDTVTEHIIYCVFEKDLDRRFTYMNGEMLRRLGVTSASEIIGKTDQELGIDRPEYEESDHKVLDGKDIPEGIFQGFEPNFEKGEDQPETIYTTKKAIRDVSGKVVGLVGVCEPGIPGNVAMNCEKILQNLPYYAILKDASGHIKWANPKFVRDDFGQPASKLFEMNGRKGATDIDLYEEVLGRKYRESDLRVVGRASSSPDPSSVFEESVELHWFRATGDRKWVRVRKTPWLDARTSAVLGVHVYFHEIQKDFCFEGIVGRWLHTHLYRALHLGAHPDGKDAAPLLFSVGQSASDRAPANMRLLILEIKIIDWIKNIIFGDAIKFVPAKEFSDGDLRWIEEILKEIYPEIHLSFKWSQQAERVVLKGDFRVLESVILILVTNAYEASQKDDFSTIVPGEVGPDGSRRSVRPLVEVWFAASEGEISVEVVDVGRGFSVEEGEEIAVGERLNRLDNAPGGGLFFIRYIARALGGSLDIKSPGPDLGATATFKCPRRTFETITSQRQLQI